MNYNTFRNRAESQMILYMNYLPSCTTIGCRMQLLEEINRLADFINEVDNMPAAKAKTDLLTYYETVESKLNE